MEIAGIVVQFWSENANDKREERENITYLVFLNGQMLNIFHTLPPNCWGLESKMFDTVGLEIKMFEKEIFPFSKV